jgi:heparosan-N-sulfate-glucuronate 5-epimerase
MGLASRWNYYRRIFPAYLGLRNSHLTFWHDSPEINPESSRYKLGQYYMPFLEKADYRGPYDGDGIPLLDYQGRLGRQYNPIAIAQYGLGNFNAYRRSGEGKRRAKFLAVANWLVRNLESNNAGLHVWNHHFDWEYRDWLRAPWQSALAQSQGISVLVRAYEETGQAMYFEYARMALQPLQKEIRDGGVLHVDEHGDTWLEEYIVSPPTHILNGFMWAIWGVYDYFLATGDTVARRIFEASVRTLRNNLACYDVGFWSLYEQSGIWLQTVASPFYHQLHIAQLRVMHFLTEETFFLHYADRWESYRQSRSKRTRALCHKFAFKLCYY